MAEKLSNQMKDLSLESDKVLGKSLETELNFCLNVEHRFLESSFERPVRLRFVYGKISITLFFLSEKRFSAPDAGKVCTIAEDYFNREMHKLGWSANYKIDQEKAAFGGFNYRLIFSYINNSKACWAGSVGEQEEENLCNCIMCEFYT